MTITINAAPVGPGSRGAMRAFFNVDTAALGTLGPIFHPVTGGDVIHASLGGYTLVLGGTGFVVDTVNNRLTAGTIETFSIDNGQVIFVTSWGASFSAPAFWDAFKNLHNGNAGAFDALWNSNSFNYIGHAGADYQRGGSQNDTFDAGANDEVIGGGGDDVITLWGSPKSIDGGDLFSSKLIIANSVTLPAQTVGIQQIEIAPEFGAAKLDLSAVHLATRIDITVTNNSNVIVVGSKEDINNILSSGGQDKLNGGNIRDIIHGGDGFDEIRGFGGHDDLFGDDGDDTIFGGDGNDYIEGNPGTDDIHGERGSDTIDGGDGQDTVHFAFNFSSYDVTKEGSWIVVKPGLAAQPDQLHSKLRDHQVPNLPHLAPSLLASEVN